MTDEEIVMALECCDDGFCDECAYKPKLFCCRDDLCHDALALINRQKAEIERLVKRIEVISNNPAIAVTFNKDQREEIAGYLELQVKKIKAEAIKEFAERLCEGRVSNDPVVVAVKVELKEMAGDPHV